MKRIFIILYYIIVLVGSSIPFWNKEYTHYHYGDNVEEILTETYTYDDTGELSKKMYWFTYTNKSGQTCKVNNLEVCYNIEWFETELKNGKYYRSTMDCVLIVVSIISIISLFFIIIQYIVYFGNGSSSLYHCNGCPLKILCPFCQRCQNTIINDDIIFLKFYKWFRNKFIEFWGYKKEDHPLNCHSAGWSESV